MSTIQVDRKKTLTDYGYQTTTTTTTKNQSQTTITPTTTKTTQSPPLTSLKRLTVHDWWTNQPENYDIPIIIHLFNQSDIYATITTQTEKAYLLSIPRRARPPLTRWIPKKAVHTIEDIKQGAKL